MKYEKYSTQVSDSFLEYTFHSHGPRGTVAKKILFEELVDLPDVYNLSFGDLNENGEIDDIVVTDNSDSEKILATIALTIAEFLQVYPDKWIHITGSTDSRTRLYRMAISKNLKELEMDYYVFGGRKWKWNRFEKNVNYDAFIVGMKK